MKHCQVCKVEYSDDVTFCSHCGNRVAEGNLEFSCPSCGRILGDTYEQFCPYCGQQVGNVQKDSSSKQGVSKKYVAIVAVMATLICGYFGFKQDLINKGYVRPDTAKEYYHYSLYLEENTKEDFSKPLLMAAEMGYPKAQFDVFKIEHKKGNFQEAFNWLSKAAEQNEAEAIVLLAGLYVGGVYEFIPENSSKALALYEKASNLGDESSTFIAGMFYCEGFGTTVDVGKGILFLEKAANNLKSKWSSAAQLYLGKIYFYPHFGVENSQKAIDWFTKAYENKHLGAITYLGLVNEAKKDFAESFKWFSLGAEKGIDVAMEGLSRAYLFGRGVAQDETKYKFWMLKSKEANIKQRELESPFQ